MNEETARHKTGHRADLLRDFGWYFASSGLPLLVGMLKTPIFTRHFSTSDYGSLGIVQVTYTYLGVVLFSWISSCLWRFYERYRSSQRSGLLNGTLLILALMAVLLLLAFSAIWYVSTANPLTRELIPLSCLHLVFSQLVMGYLVIVRLESRAFLYTTFQSFRAVSSFVLTLVLVFWFDQNISALLLGMAAMDGLTLLILALWNPIRMGFSFKGFEKEEIKELLSYGGAGLILNISLLSLMISDRYVVLYSEGLSSVGIYDQVYKISQLSVAALVTVFFNTINPGLFRVLEHDFDGSLKIMSRHLRVFLLLGLPVVVYLSLYSRSLASLLLGPEFRAAYVMMPFVFLAAYLQGISNFFEMRMKFSGRMRLLTLVFVSGALCNLLLNLLLVPRYGYFWAAVTTLITYALIITFFVRADRSLFSAMVAHQSELVRFLGLLALQSVIFLGLMKYEPSLLMRIGLGLIFVLSYAWLLQHEGFFKDKLEPDEN